MLNEETRELRKDRIGGSDIGVILGLSAFKTREQLLREKVTGVSDFTTNKYIEFGNEAEATLFECSRKYFPEEGELVADYCEYDDKYIANLDGLLKGKKNIVLEIKTTSEKNVQNMIEKVQHKKHAYYYQVQHYMKMTGSKLATFVVYPVSEYEYENGVDFMDLDKVLTFNIKYDSKETNKMYKECEKFLKEVEKAKAEGLPQDVITLDDKTDELVEKLSGVMSVYADVESQLKELKKQKESFENELEQHMRENGVKSFETNGYKFTIAKDSERRTLDKKLVEKLLTKEQYELCEKVTHVNGSLRVTKMKG